MNNNINTNTKQHLHITPNNNLYSIITPQKQLDSPIILTTHKPTTSKDTNKEYLNEIQEQIDILEQKLFSNDEPDEYEHFPNEQQTNNITDVIVNDTNKDNNMPQQITTETNHSQQDIYQSNNERDELYQIILRERRDYAELEQLRKEQDSKYKELQLKCNELSIRNQELANTVDILQQEKQELQNQIALLTKHNYNNNSYNTTHHHQHHPLNEMTYIFSKKNQPYNTYYSSNSNSNIKYK